MISRCTGSIRFRPTPPKGSRKNSRAISRISGLADRPETEGRGAVHSPPSAEPPTSRSRGALVAGIVAIILAAPSTAHAYLDPGTGSYLFQVIAAVLLGALFSLKIFWANIKSILANRFSRRKPDESTSPPDD